MVGIVDFGSKKTPDILAILNKLGYESQIVPWKECNEDCLKKFDSIILSGAPVLFTEIDYQPYLDKFTFLKNTTVPVLGICFGHQLIGLIYGSEVFKGEAVREQTTIKILKDNVLFKGLGIKSKMIQDHTEGITLPDNFTCLARSDRYEVEAMKHISKSIYGVQFHPEVSGNAGEKLLSNFLTLF